MKEFNFRNIFIWIILPSFVIGNLSLVIFLYGCGDLNTGVASLTINPPNATIGVKQTQVFTVIAKDSMGKIISATPTWSVQGNIGSISSNGMLTAGAVDATGAVIVAADSLTAQSNISVVSTGWINGQVLNQRGQSIQGINILLQSTTYETQSVVNGKYSLAGVPAGAYMITTQDPSGIYQPVTPESVTVASGETVPSHNFTIFYYILPPDTTPSTLAPL